MRRPRSLTSDKRILKKYLKAADKLGLTDEQKVRYLKANRKQKKELLRQFKEEDKRAHAMESKSRRRKCSGRFKRNIGKLIAVSAVLLTLGYQYQSIKKLEELVRDYKNEKQVVETAHKKTKKKLTETEEKLTETERKLTETGEKLTKTKGKLTAVTTQLKNTEEIFEQANEIIAKQKSRNVSSMKTTHVQSNKRTRGEIMWDGVMSLLAPESADKVKKTPNTPHITAPPPPQTPSPAPQTASPPSAPPRVAPFHLHHHPHATARVRSAHNPSPLPFGAYVR